MKFLERVMRKSYASKIMELLRIKRKRWMVSINFIHRLSSNLIRDRTVKHFINVTFKYSFIRLSEVFLFMC